MDAVFIAVGVGAMAWGLLALVVAWVRPSLRTHPLLKDVLLVGKVEPTRLAHTLAASIPLLFGAYLVLSSLDVHGPLWPLLVLTALLFVASVALHLQRHDV